MGIKGVDPPMLIKEGNVFFKLIYWGPAGSGKTTCLKTLRKLTESRNLEVKPSGDLKSIAMADGATLYFDHGVFQSLRDPKLFYHAYTVAGQSQFENLRKKVLAGTDGIIIVFDSNTPRKRECINSLKELKNLVGMERLIEMPLVVLLNKKDLPPVISTEEVTDWFRDLGLWFDAPAFPYQNPRIYETIALFKKKLNIYESFYDCAHRTIQKTMQKPSK